MHNNQGGYDVNANGCEMCQAEKYLKTCGERGNIFAKMLLDFWRQGTPQVIPASNSTQIQARSLRATGSTGQTIARNLVPQMMQDRFGSVPGPFNAKVDATLTETIDLLTAFPDVWEIAALHRVSYTQNVDDNAVNVTRIRTPKDTSTAVVRETETEYTSSSLGCPTGSRVTTNAMILNTVDMGGVGLPLAVVAQFGPQIQTLAAHVANGQKNAAEDVFIAPEGTGLQVTSIHAAHTWMCDLFLGLDVLQGNDMSEQQYQQMENAKAQVQNMMAELQAQMQQYQQVYAQNGYNMQQNGFMAQNGYVPPNGYALQPNGLMAPINQPVTTSVAPGAPNGIANGVPNGNGAGVRKVAVRIPKNGKTGADMERNGTNNQPRIMNNMPQVQQPFMAEHAPNNPGYQWRPYGG